MSSLVIEWRRGFYSEPGVEQFCVEVNQMNLLSMRVRSGREREAFLGAAGVVVDAYLRNQIFESNSLHFTPPDPMRLGISASLVHALSCFSLNPPPRHDRTIARFAAAELLALCDKLESEGR